jgi:tRNA(Ile)-lysidine synthase
MAVALSGGLDSSACCCTWPTPTRSSAVTLHAFHVHHGLSPNADAWLAHCEQQCAALNVPFAARRIQLQDPKSPAPKPPPARPATPPWARCAPSTASLLLTAHHLDDQAETVLLQLLRGSGPAGLSGMDAANTAASLLQNDKPGHGPPAAASLAQAAGKLRRQHNISHIHDESNDDPRYARNALRHP